MNKKEILIIFILAALVTHLSGFYVVDRSSWQISLGWPWVYRIKYIVHPSWGGPGAPPSPGYFVTNQTLVYRSLILDFLFWLLIIFAIWRIIQLVKKKNV